MEAFNQPRAESVLRLLASSVNTTRLYPAASPLRDCAVDAFTTRANAVTSQTGPLRFTVDAHGFRLGSDVLSRPFSQTTQLAETLHALQVGQLVIARGVNRREIFAFLDAVLADPALIQREGGIRARLLRAGVGHMAVIEVRPLASREGSLCGADLAMLPLSDMAEAIVASAQDWATSAGIGKGRDCMLEAMEDIEPAVRVLALHRAASALLRLDEENRMRVLAWALKPDATGARMAGVLSTFATMSPAVLARLFTVTASHAGTTPARIADAIDLTPDVAGDVALLLAPSPVAESDCGVPASIDHVAMLEALLAESDHSECQTHTPGPMSAAGRALTASVVVSRRYPNADSVEAIGMALPRAASEGAFVSTRIALRRLDELAWQPELIEPVSKVKAALAERAILTDVCRAIASRDDAAVAAKILTLVGSLGTHFLVDAYDRAPERQQALMRPILRGMRAHVLGEAKSRLRGNDAFAAVRVVRTLPSLEDPRVVPTLTDALHDVRTEVRLAAVKALADTPFTESRQALGRALSHWDLETRRFAVQEIARVSALEAVPSLLRSLEDFNVFRLDYELKKDIVRGLVQIGSTEALPALRRIARRPAVRSNTRQLRVLAQRAVLSIAQRGPAAEGDSGLEHVPPVQGQRVSLGKRTRTRVKVVPHTSDRARESTAPKRGWSGVPQPVTTASGGVDHRE